MSYYCLKNIYKMKVELLASIYVLVEKQELHFLYGDLGLNEITLYPLSRTTQFAGFKFTFSRRCYHDAYTISLFP